MNYNLLPAKQVDGSVLVVVTDDSGRVLQTHMVSSDESETWEDNTRKAVDDLDNLTGVDKSTRNIVVSRQLI